ncbi:Cytochrome b-c1 complex subunit 7 [Kappamyces sp. JEL0680]|nr:Cytochrome b-c1 complex subunit 7 [Kappamyces sp. JEL0680]
MSVILKTLENIRALKQSKPYLAISEMHSNLMGYRKQGLFYDDLVPEENEIVKEALNRLSPQERLARTFRFRHFSSSIGVDKARRGDDDGRLMVQDVRYLEPILKVIEAEETARFYYGNMTSIPKALLTRNKSS